MIKIGNLMSSLIDVATAGRYNEWANNRLYNALNLLTDQERKQDRKAFLGKISNYFSCIK